MEVDTAKYLPEDPPKLLAAKQYYRRLKELVAAQSAPSSPRNNKATDKVIASPMKKRIKRVRDTAEPVVVSAEDLHLKAKVSDRSL